MLSLEENQGATVKLLLSCQCDHRCPTPVFHCAHGELLGCLEQLCHVGKDCGDHWWWARIAQNKGKLSPAVLCFCRVCSFPCRALLNRKQCRVCRERCYLLLNGWKCVSQLCLVLSHNVPALNVKFQIEESLLQDMQIVLLKITFFPTNLDHIISDHH